MFDLCRTEIESYQRRIRTYIACRLEEVEDQSNELQRKLNETIETYNCYARGEDFC